MRWSHFEAEPNEGLDEFWASDFKIHGDISIEVHIGKDFKTGRYDFQLLNQGREALCRTGFQTRRAAEVAMRAALKMILHGAIKRLEEEEK